MAPRGRRTRHAAAGKGGDFEELMRDIEQEARRAGTKATAEYAAFGAYHRLARQVFDLRKGAGLTRRQFAAKSAVRQADISRIEAGDANPTLATIAALAYALGAEVSLTIGRGDEVGEAQTLVHSDRASPSPRARDRSHHATTPARYAAKARTD